MLGGILFQNPAPENARLRDAQSHRAGDDGLDFKDGVVVLQPEAVAPVRADHPEPEILIRINPGVDPAEHAALEASDITVNDMRVLDEFGFAVPMRAFLDKVRAADGMLHVSLDVDFLDPSVAPAVGTTVPGGATFREAHLVCELIHESGLMTSLDLVELNPFLDDRGRTTRMMVDLVGSLMGRKVFDRPTRSG